MQWNNICSGHWYMRLVTENNVIVCDVICLLWYIYPYHAPTHMYGLWMVTFSGSHVPGPPLQFVKAKTVIMYEMIFLL